MFEFLKKNFKLVAPISGKVIDLSKVQDEIFAHKMAGDGIAIEVTGDQVVAPADGEITFIFKTNHAFGMLLDNGVELLIHVGLDTIGLAGEGFKRLVNEGQKVKVGQPIIKIDTEILKDKGCSLILPLLITNIERISFYNQSIGQVVTAGTDVVVEYKLNR